MSLTCSGVQTLFASEFNNPSRSDGNGRFAKLSGPASGLSCAGNEDEIKFKE